MKKETLKFVIVGHVDHGKSTLIGRILVDSHSLSPDKLEEIEKTSRELGRRVEFAYLVDHLQEEREQGVTIDTTQIFFKTDIREYVIIDAPGHVEFVKNMITGASQAEAALLIVDVEGGVQEQTKRHAYLLSLLGITRMIVLLNKMDLVGFKEEKYQEVKKELQEFLKSLRLEPRCYIPISAIDGDNIVTGSRHTPWYDGKTVLESLDLLENAPSNEAKQLIFPIQDVYRMDEKRIVVGKIATGRLKVGERIKVLPDGLETTVRTIEKFPGYAEEAGSEESIGLTVSDSLFLERGQVVCSSGKEPQGLYQNKIDNLPEAILERDKERRRLRTPCGTEAMSDAVAAQKRPGPSGNPIFGLLRRCSSVMCHRGHRTFVAPCTNLKSGTPNSQFYSGTTPKVTDTFRANLFWMAKDPLIVSERITLRCTTQSLFCQVSKIFQRMDSATLEIIEKNAGHLNNLEVGEVEIKTKKPLVIEKFSEIPELGRFVLSRENNICAGGIIIATE
ncbi:MAG: GTP-binding protein [Candidatus Omnitrophota bacterium]